LWLLERLSRHHEIRVYALWQAALPRRYRLSGTEVFAAGPRWGRVRSITALMGDHVRRPFDVLHAFWMPPAAVASLVGRIVHRPVVAHLAGGELVAMPEIAYGGLLRRSGRWQARVALNGAAVLTASTDTMLEEVAAFGYAAERLVLGVDLTQWPPRAPRARNGGPGNLVHVGSLNGVKDQATLVHAMAVLRDLGTPFHLHMVGEDTLEGVTQRAVLEAGLGELITFHGFMCNADVRRLVERSDLLVMSSRHEAAEMVTLEAGAVGVPAVGTATGRIGEWAPEAAVAVPIGDAEALGRAVGRLLADEPARLAIAQAAHQLALRDNADATARDVDALYRRVVERRK
jgi:glycosyltransferase involved in cell wall biosynthesis